MLWQILVVQCATFLQCLQAVQHDCSMWLAAFRLEAHHLTANASQDCIDPACAQNP